LHWNKSWFVTAQISPEIRQIKAKEATSEFFMVLRLYSTPIFDYRKTE
jgi:hypothetical protein